VWAAGCLSAVLISLGDPEKAQSYLQADVAIAERMRYRLALFYAFSHSEGLFLSLGDWESSREAMEGTLRLNPNSAGTLARLSLLEHTLGHFDQGNAYLERLQEVISLVPANWSQTYALVAPCAVIPQIGYITGSAEHFDFARAAAQALFSSPYRTPLHTWKASLGLGLMAVQQGDRAAAQEQYSILHASRPPSLALVDAYYSLPTDRILGLLAQTLGDLDKATEYFEDALAFCRKAGYRPQLAWTCHDYAEALIVGAGLKPAPTLGNREKAISLLDEALKISQELGMRPLMERVVKLQQEAGSQPVGAHGRAPLQYPDGLTGREVEVLRLIALGRSNRKIAEELVISLNTVFRHVSNIFNKTGVANRAEAATYAARHGLA